MQQLSYQFPADRVPQRRVHVGVVASGDLEVLLDTAAGDSDDSVADVVVPPKPGPAIFTAIQKPKTRPR